MWTCIAGQHNALIKISSAQVSVIQTKLWEATIDSGHLLWFCLRHIKLAESTVRSQSFYLSRCFFSPTLLPSFSNSVMFIRDALLHVVCRLRRRNFLIYSEHRQQPAAGWLKYVQFESESDWWMRLVLGEDTHSLSFFLFVFFSGLRVGLIWTRSCSAAKHEPVVNISHQHSDACVCVCECVSACCAGHSQCVNSLVTQLSRV